MEIWDLVVGVERMDALGLVALGVVMELYDTLLVYCCLAVSVGVQ